MMHSMTAFARRQEAAAGFAIAWEMRSLNQRFLDVQFRLPEELRSLEHPLREQVGQRVKRGKLICVLSLEQIGAPRSLELNRPLLLQLLAALEQVRRDAPEAHAANPIDLLHWPGMLKSAVAGEPLVAAATEVFQETLGALLKARRAEGEKLKVGFSARLDEIDGIIAESRRLTTDLAAEWRAKLKKRLAELDANVADGRLEQEVAPAGAEGRRGRRTRPFGHSSAGRPQPSGRPWSPWPSAGLHHPGNDARGQHPRRQVRAAESRANHRGLEGRHRANTRAGAEH